MYDLAYEAAPEQEQKQILVLAKQIVKMQYQAAKTKGDIQVQQRLRRDYGNNKAMSDIFK